MIKTVFKNKFGKNLKGKDRLSYFEDEMQSVYELDEEDDVSYYNMSLDQNMSPVKIRK
jgi:hypothetical protein